MSAALPYETYRQNTGTRLFQAWLLTGISDMCFASAQAIINGNSPARTWQGVASVLFGKAALESSSYVWVGLLMHYTVAFWWSAVFLFVLMRLNWVRSILASPYGVLKMAAIYGPFIWSAMSLVVIPVLLKRPPNVAPRWLIQFFGHIPFVALPLVWGAGRAPKTA